MAENDYEKSIGVWTHTIGGITHKIVPEEEDNIEFIRVKRDADKGKDSVVLNKGILELYFGMVIRSEDWKSAVAGLNDPDKEKKEKFLRSWISVNINQVTRDLMIAFNWTTAEKLNRIEERLLKQEAETVKKNMTSNQGY